MDSCIYTYPYCDPNYLGFYYQPRYTFFAFKMVFPNGGMENLRELTMIVTVAK